MEKTIKITIAVLLGIYVISMLSMTSALTINSVNTNPSEIAPGETSTVDIKLENDGEYNIFDVSVELIFRELIKDSFGNVASIEEIPFAPYGSSSEDSFDKIEEGDDETARFKIITLNNAKSGIYKIPVEITYTEESAVKTKNSLISLTVNSEPIIGASLEDGLLLKEKENEVNIKIVNKGLSDVKFLEIDLGSSTYYDILSTKNVYIGDIDSDDFDTVDFNVYFKANAPNSINLPVIITYKDVLNKEHIENFNLQVRVYTEDKAIELGLLEKSKTMMYVGIIVGLIVLYIIYKKIKKYRKLKKVKADASV